MKNLFKLTLLAGATFFVSCTEEDVTNVTNVIEGATEVADYEPMDSSLTDVETMFDVKSAFSSINVETILSSEDIIPSSPDFVYGSMADGAGLLKNDDGTYTLINNIEADYAVARIFLNQDLKPLYGEYLMSSTSTSSTAMCSGSLITEEEHGFGPYYLSGGEWGGNAKGVYVVDPYRDVTLKNVGERLLNWGEWSTENAVVIGKDAYASKTVAIIGDDDSDNSIPQGHIGMYVGDQGDLYSGDLYVLRVKEDEDTLEYEMGMETRISYTAEWVKMSEREIDALNSEAMDSVCTGFSRVEDIDWRRGSAANQREIYVCVTGRQKTDLYTRGTISGRIYKINLNDSDPTGDCTIEAILDGDASGNATEEGMHSPDNILVTENYAYIQEDPNGVVGATVGEITVPAKSGYAKLYQYDLETGDLEVILECNQTVAEAAGYGTTASTWEITGMIDVTETMNALEPTFLIITQNHGWEGTRPGDGSEFSDPVGSPSAWSKEGSVLYKITGLAR